MTVHSIDGTLACDIGRKTLAQCTDIIVVSNIISYCPSNGKLYTKEVILRLFTKNVNDKKKKSLVQIVLL